MKFPMKKILFLTGLITLFAATGCLASEGGHRGYGHARHESHSAVMVPAPVVVVPAPVVIVPAVRVRVD